jgi:hypothetical protein
VLKELRGQGTITGVSKKTEKLIKLRKSWKKPIKPIKILKKSTGSFRFQFYKLDTEKTEPNPNRKKLSQTGKKPSQN